jgi:hypothetical protein
LVETQTTCSKGVYRIYYTIQISNVATITNIDRHKTSYQLLKIVEKWCTYWFSSVNTAYAKSRIEPISSSVLKLHHNGISCRIKVEGEKEEDLFYLYCIAVYKPFLISEKTEFMRLLMEQSKI